MFAELAEKVPFGQVSTGMLPELDDCNPASQWRFVRRTEVECRISQTLRAQQFCRYRTGPTQNPARLEIHSRHIDDRPVRGSGIDAVYDRLQFGVKGQGCIHDREYTGLALQVRERA